MPKSAVLPLVVFNIFIFILQIAFDGVGFTNHFMLVSEDIFARPWILLTSMFLHSSPSHILFNMYALFLFGPLLEYRVGPKRFLFVYIGAGVVSAFLSSFFYSRALGASGAIMGMLGTLIILLPQLRLLLFFFIPMPLWMAGIVWALLDAFGVLFPTGVGNIAHLVGMGFGVLYGFSLRREKKRYSRNFTSKTHLDSDDAEDYLKSGRI